METRPGIYSVTFALPAPDLLPDPSKTIHKSKTDLIGQDPKQILLPIVQQSCRAFGSRRHCDAKYYLPREPAPRYRSTSIDGNLNPHSSSTSIRSESTKSSLPETQSAPIVVSLRGPPGDIIQAKSELLSTVPRLVCLPLTIRQSLGLDDEAIESRLLGSIDNITRETGATIFIQRTSDSGTLGISKSNNPRRSSIQTSPQNGLAPMRVASRSSNHSDSLAIPNTTARDLADDRSRRSSADTASIDSSGLCVYTYGDLASAEHARNALYVQLDVLANPKTVTKTRPLSLSMQTIIGGKQASVLHEHLQLMPHANVYFYPALVESTARLSTAPSNANFSQISITGSQEAVDECDRAISLLEDKTQIVTHELSIFNVKLNWLLTEQFEQLDEIMRENATFVRFPMVGSSIGSSTVRIQGKTMDNVRKVQAAIDNLMMKLQHATIFLLPRGMNSDIGPQLPPLTPDLIESLMSVALMTGAEIVFQGTRFELTAPERALHQALWQLNNLPMLLPSPQETQYSMPQALAGGVHKWIKLQLEAPIRDLEFISGKKFGKIDKIKQHLDFRTGQGDIKIVRMNGLTGEQFSGISSTVPNQGNFFIEIYAADIDRAVRANDLIKLEFPAELTFHIPEEYHKRLIGFRGEQIQRVMKLYNSYIEFSARAFDPVVNHNVLVRTPEKFRDNLFAVRDLFLEAAESFVNGTPWPGPINPPFQQPAAHQKQNMQPRQQINGSAQNSMHPNQHYLNQHQPVARNSGLQLAPGQHKYGQRPATSNKPAAQAGYQADTPTPQSHQQLHQPQPQRRHYPIHQHPAYHDSSPFGMTGPPIPSSSPYRMMPAGGNGLVSNSPPVHLHQAMAQMSFHPRPNEHFLPQQFQNSLQAHPPIHLTQHYTSDQHPTDDQFQYAYHQK